MKLIAHRGLINGPDSILENSPNQIINTLNLGYQAEIDVWLIDGVWYLGHDNPTHPISYSFLNQIGLWIHAKNLDALYALCNTNYNYFWHQNDDFTLTSHGFIWTYPNKPLTKKSICVLPEWHDPSLEVVKGINCYGICSDYVALLK